MSRLSSPRLRPVVVTTLLIGGAVLLSSSRVSAQDAGIDAAVERYVADIIQKRHRFTNSPSWGTVNSRRQLWSLLTFVP